MQDINKRSSEAQALWTAGDAAQAAGRYDEAWQRYTEAHDLVTDCPALHRRAHHKLRTVNRRNGHWGEYVTDSVLLALAPLGIFELIAVYFRSKVADAEPCRRRAGTAYSI